MRTAKPTVTVLYSSEGKPLETILQEAFLVFLRGRISALLDGDDRDAGPP